MSWNRRVRRYQHFLKSLKRPESSLCSCPVHIHPRPWVPPPCLTSRPQQAVGSLLWHKRSMSNPELRMRSTSFQAKADDDDQQQDSLQHLYSEARLLKETFNKVRQGDQIPKHSRDLVRKWSEKRRDGRTRSKTEPFGQPTEANEQIAELDRSFAEAVQEEEALRQELNNLRQIAQDRSAYVEENRKLKKKIQQLQWRIKRQDEAQRISRESLQEERELGSREEYVLMSLKKKYDDLLQYVLKVESENQKLKSLAGVSGEGDEFFRDFDRENSEYERHSIARLQTDLEALRSEMRKKDSYILECEERLQAMEALKEENLTLHKSLRNKRETDVRLDPQDVSTALEEEWMRRLSETREMYERAIEGYRDQLQEMQEKYHNAEVKHATHVQQLMQDIEELQIKVRSEEINYKEPRGSITRKRNGTQRDSEIRPLTVNEGNNERIEEPADHGVSRREETQRDSGTIPASVNDDNQEQEILSTSGESKMESEKAKGPDELVRQEERKGEETSGLRSYKKTMSDSSTQTVKLQKRGSEETSIKDDVEPALPVHGIDEEMRESKQYLERVNSLVKKLESMKLNGDGAEAVLAVIRDTINQCLHEWRESFQLQKASQKDSADELNKGYVDLQRKLRAKSKQLESKHKQCKLLEEKNATLTQQCSQLEAKIAALQASDRLGMLQDLPDALRNTEQRLSELQGALQNSQEEKLALQEQIKLLSEKLRRKDTKLAAEHEQVLVKEKEIKHLQEVIASLKKEIEEVSRDVHKIQEQLSTKDVILEHTSAQLEERIRECARLSSQIERQRLELNQEARKTQVQITEHESASQRQLIDAEAKAARYQSQLSALRSEKDHNEKSLRQNIRKLEEQVDQLQLRNSTLQRQLTTITSTYHSMFTSVDVNPLSPPGLGNPTV